MDASPLRTLPPELRNTIYDLVLCVPWPVGLQLVINPTKIGTRQSVKSLKCTRSPDVRNALSLTETCKEIRNETPAMFYAINRFTFFASIHQERNKHDTLLSAIRDVRQCRQWLDSIGPRSAEALTRLAVSINADFHPASFRDRLDVWVVMGEQLHSVLDPGVMSLGVPVIFKIPRSSPRIRFGNRFRTCHPDVIADLTRDSFLLPFTDKKLASEAVEAKYTSKMDEVDQRAAEYSCCVRPSAEEIRRQLDVCRTFLQTRIERS